MKRILSTLSQAIAVGFFGMLTSQAVAQTNPAAWELQFDSGDVQTYERTITDKAVKESKATATFTANVDNVVSKLRYPVHYTYWMGGVFSAWELLKEDADGSSYIYAQFREAKTGEPMDVVLHISMKSTATGAFLVIEDAPDMKPSTNAYTRVKNLSMKTMVRAEGADAVNMTMVAYSEGTTQNNPFADVIKQMVTNMKTVSSSMQAANK